MALKLNIQKTKIMASSPITSWQIDGETMETVTDFIFLGSKITEDGDCSHKITRYLLLGRKAMTNLVQFSSVTQSCLTDSLQPHGLRHIRLPCPLSTAGVYPNPYPLMPSNHLIFCCPLLILPSTFPSIRVFSDELVLHIR